MILFYAFLSYSIFIKYNSTNIQCTQCCPCNFSIALTHIKENTKIFICDSKIQQKKHLIDFCSFMENINNMQFNKIAIIGCSTEVDGSLFPSSFFSFTSILSHRIDFSNFIFHNFQHPILYYRNSVNSTLTNITFESNRLTDQISVLAATSSSLTFSNVTFRDSLQYRSSFLCFTSSNINIEKCRFKNISMPTVTDSYLILSIESHVKIEQTNLTDIKFINSGLFLSSSSSFLLMKKNFFEKNFFNEMIAVTLNSMVRVESCEISENQGAILVAHKGTSVSFVNSIFKGNVATSSELFVVKKSKISINYDCQFTNNVVHSILLLKGNGGFANISYSDFISNVALSSFLTVKSQSKLTMKKCLFRSNISPYQLLEVDNQASAIVAEISFNDIHTRALSVTQFSSLNCSDIEFNGRPFIDESLISVKKSSYLTVDSSQFNIQSLKKALISSKISSVTNVQNSFFDGSIESTFNMSYNCVNCTFRRPNEVKSKPVFRVSYFKAFYVLMILFAIFEAGMLTLTCSITFKNLSFE